MKTAKQLFDAAFPKDTYRSLRSEAYKNGVLSHLQYRLKETTEYHNPYDVASAERDAFWAGVDEAWLILRHEDCDLLSPNTADVVTAPRTPQQGGR